jgi:NAD(P)-dependent dehydrogenase (short-subunit alcohol dehydrogenase family)
MARNVERGQEARRIVQESTPGVSVNFVQGDANDLQQAAVAADKAKTHVQNIDILVNTTTCSFVPELFHKTPLENIGPILNQLITAPLQMCGIVLPGMRQRGTGVIVNVASDAAKSATPGETVIGAAMAAIVMFSKTLAMEAKRDGVRVNVLTPSLISGTPLTAMAMKEGFSARLFQKAETLAHLGVPTPEDLAVMVSFLASPLAARITGQAISINGGISAA